MIGTSDVDELHRDVALSQQFFTDVVGLGTAADRSPLDGDKEGIGEALQCNTGVGCQCGGCNLRSAEL